jgi:UDP-2-acetamido-3-amino-2,3-dideoxy-glucuronate N-acetyltransferase
MKYYSHPSSIIDEGAIIGHDTKVWHFSHLMSGCNVGNNCTIGQNVFIASTVRIGNNVKVQNNVSLYDGVICEDDVFIGPSVVFTNVINPRSATPRRSEYKPTIIRKGASIGANATVICGNEIGKYAFIGAGSVVTKPVLAYALLVGNPAHQVGWMSEYGNKLEFNEDGYAECIYTNQVYRLKNKIVFKEGN